MNLVPAGFEDKPKQYRPSLRPKYAKKARKRFGPRKNRWSNSAFRFRRNLKHPRPCSPGLVRNYILNGPPTTKWAFEGHVIKWLSIGRRIKSSRIEKCKKKHLCKNYNEFRYRFKSDYLRKLSRRLKSSPGKITHLLNKDWVKKQGQPYYIMGG